MKKCVVSSFSLAALLSCSALAQLPYRPATPQMHTGAQSRASETSPGSASSGGHITLRVVGSVVHDRSGGRLGRIEEVLVNPQSGQIEFAALATGFPTNNARLVPVPWSLLRYEWDQSQAGGPAGANQIFSAA